jgi:hypothetical protein
VELNELGFRKFSLQDPNFFFFIPRIIPDYFGMDARVLQVWLKNRAFGTL